jgi:single-stranded-DNA-specific exonuclease
MHTERPIALRGEPDPAVLGKLDAIDPLFARLYALRGVTDAGHLDYGLAGLAPVSALDNVDAAVELLIAHRDKRIIVVGDFDVDGATSTALMLRCFRAFGFSDVDYLVPNRFDYGYGLTPEIVRVAAGHDPDLIVTVDNGISSAEGVREAREKGIAVLITDHHLPPDDIPDAEVIVNPNLDGSIFPSRNLAGVGVVPLDHNNRILVQQGLNRIRAGHTVAGIRALLEQSGRQLSRTVSTDLGFVAGPRINAAGRLEDISVGIECLLTDDDAIATQYAQVLDGINKERREIESTMREQAFAYVSKLESHKWPPCVCVYEEEWHQGVVGLIAARVRERCHRPVIAFARESEGYLKGSARSIPGVHARDLLEAVSGTHPEIIEKFGGHAMAAGLTIAESNYREFASAVAEQMTRLYPDADFSGAIVSDGVLPDTAINLQFARALRDAGPWGSAFPEPLWHGDFELLEQRTVGEKHLKMRLRPAGGGTVVDAIAFNQAGPAYRGVVQLAYRLDVNEYRGVESAQLIVEQIAAL